MPPVNEAKLSDYQSEILFLLIGENPLPNYVAAKLLTKRFENDETPILYLIHSKDTENYADNLAGVLNPDKENKLFTCLKVRVEPSNYFNIKDEINSRLKKVTEIADERKIQITIGLNYTGGTKAMAVHTHRAISNLIQSQKVKFSYLDPRKKFMRFDESIPNEGQWWIDITDVNSLAFKMTKISLDQLLALHGWEKFERQTDNPIINIRFDDEALNLANLRNFNGSMFEDYISSKVFSLKNECFLHEAGTNLEISIPNETNLIFFELDIFAIRGYQLFVISCTLEGRSDSAGKELRKAKLFEAVHRARQLGGAEARIGLVCLADEDRTELLEKQLKNDHIEVWGKADLQNLKTNLKGWFNA